MTHWLHPDAEKELGDAAEYYLIHAGRVVMESFLTEYVQVRDLIIQNQKLALLTDSGMRVCHFENFPYSLIYEANENMGPQIFAIAHQRRKPGYWEQRLT